jgi:hypothetical protein
MHHYVHFTHFEQKRSTTNLQIISTLVVFINTSTLHGFTIYSKRYLYEYFKKWFQMYIHMVTQRDSWGIYFLYPVEFHYSFIPVALKMTEI